MTGPTGWNARTALAKLPTRAWNGHAWRFHKRRYKATDASGSLLVSGRYHRAPDRFPANRVWAALYLALGAEVALGEVLRHVTPESPSDLNDYRLSELQVELDAIVDCRDAPALGLNPDDLVHDYDFHVTQDLAAAVIALNMEGMLVPSATRLGDNLIVFPHRLRSDSRLAVLDSRDPRLHVQR